MHWICSSCGNFFSADNPKCDECGSSDVFEDRIAQYQATLSKPKRDIGLWVEDIGYWVKVGAAAIMTAFCGYGLSGLESDIGLLQIVLFLVYVVLMFPAFLGIVVFIFEIPRGVATLWNEAEAHDWRIMAIIIMSVFAFWFFFGR